MDSMRRISESVHANFRYRQPRVLRKILAKRYDLRLITNASGSWKGSPMRMRSLLLTIFLSLAVLTSSAGTAGAIQHSNAYAYQYWTISSTRWNTTIDQDVRPIKISAYSFFAMGAYFGGTNNGFYMGLQQNGASSNYRNARVSIWGSTAAVPASGSTCRAFGGEGIGYTCERPYAYVTNVTYRYMFRLVNTSDPKGLWWGAWVKNTSTGSYAYLGKIRAAYGAGFPTYGLYNFNEYYGTKVLCTAVPTSEAIYFPPVFNGGWKSGYGGKAIGNCSGGRIIQGYGVSVITLGYR